MTETSAFITIEAEHNCFGCGRLNRHGLQLAFQPDDRGGVCTRLVPDRRFEGYDGMIHGGIVSTVLDEVMAWSLYRHAIWAVTGELTVRYRSPIRIGEATRATGWMTARRGRRIEMASEIVRESDGAVLARGTGVFVAVPEEQGEAWRQRYLGDGSLQAVDIGDDA